MATATDYGSNGFSRSSSISVARSPDTASSLYPERAIRPLPKNRLKSKLSPEQVSTIVYPPDPPPVSPNLSFTAPDPRSTSSQQRLVNGDVHQHSHHHDHHAVHHCTCGADGDSGDEDVEFDHPDYRYSAAPVVNGTAAHRTAPAHRRLAESARGSSKPTEQESTASSGDGYDSFENTSNKKKRKIPLSGAPSAHQSQLSADMANMGISNGQTDGAGDDAVLNSASQQQQYYSAQHTTSTSVSASGTGISGAGRGRYGRQDGKYRRPLGSSTMNAINGYSSRGSHRGGEMRNGADTGVENTGGIISQAIKTAAEQGPLTPAAKGRENANLLQSAAGPNSAASNTKTQFTFFRESESANKMVDQQTATASTPTPARYPPPGMKGAGSYGTQGPPARNHPQVNHAGRVPPPAVNGAPGMNQQQQAMPPPKPRPRRNPAKEYALQAANRKKQQQISNYHHRPKPESMWICEFCEYEDIYGVPPAAMIRRYEIKDRQERKKAAEKRRLLEKARMKGRKNKKGSGKSGKNNHGNNGAAPPVTPANSQNYDPNLPPPDADDYYEDDDEYGDEYSPVGHPGYDYPQDYHQPPVDNLVTPGAGPGAGGRGHHHRHHG